MQNGFSRRNAARQQNHKSRRAAIKRRRLLFHFLEDRRLLSAGSLDTPPAWTAAPMSGETSAQQVNTVQNTTNGGFYYPYAMDTSVPPYYLPSARSVATFGDGSSVVVWADVQSGDLTYNLMMQQYGPSGNAIGSPITVAAGDNLPGIIVATQQTATASNFVVTWPEAMTSKKGSEYTVTHAEVWQFGNSSPTASATIGSNGSGFLALSVAMDAAGNFDLLSDGGSVQRFNSAAQVVGAPIAATTPHNQPLAWGGIDDAIAMDAAGDFVVSWNNTVVTQVIQKHTVVATNYTDYVYAERFAVSSGTVTPEGVVTVEQGTQNGDHLAQTDVGMDAAGDFVVTWRDAYVHQVGGPATVWGSVYADVFYAAGGSTGPIDAVPVNLDYGGGPNGQTIVNSAVIEDEVPSVVAQPTGGGAFDLAWTALSEVYDSTTATWASHQYVYGEQFDAFGGPSSQGPVLIYETQPNPSGGNGIMGWASAAVDANNDMLVVYSLNPNDTPPSGFTSSDGEVFAQFYLDPPTPETSASTASSSSGNAAPSGSSTAATDAVFAYAYPDDDTLD